MLCAHGVLVLVKLTLPGDPPLLGVHEIVAEVVGELDEKIAQIGVLEESLLGLLVVAVARIPHEGVILVGQLLGSSRLAVSDVRDLGSPQLLALTPLVDHH